MVTLSAIPADTHRGVPNRMEGRRHVPRNVVQDLDELVHSEATVSAAARSASRSTRISLRASAAVPRRCEQTAATTCAPSRPLRPALAAAVAAWKASCAGDVDLNVAASGRPLGAQRRPRCRKRPAPRNESCRAPRQTWCGRRRPDGTPRRPCRPAGSTPTEEVFGAGQYVSPPA